MRHVCPECGATYAAPGRCPADGATLAPGDDPLLGQTLSSYRVARLLGAGGMGRVYKAVQPAIGARVAIKVLSQECAADPQLVERFFAEARAVNLIRHEQIVNILDLSRLPDGRPYIVMEYLDGAPLSAVLAARGALPLGTAAQLTLEVLDALAAAHAHGIVHRDLKPDNVWVTVSGRAKVLDFGIAKLDPTLTGGGAAKAATRAGSLLGTPAYMSPEQAMTRPVDLRSDLYSLGVILYEMVTGQVPFSAPSLFEMLRLHLEAPPRPPRTLRADLPPAMEAVILAALAKDPGQRFADAAAMAGALAAATQGLPPDAWQSLRTSGGVGIPGAVITPSGPPRVDSSLARGPTVGARRRRAGLLVALLLLVAAIGGAAAYFATREAPAVAPLADAAPPPGPVTPPPPARPDAPPAMDLARFDAVAWIPDATALARQKIPDAELTALIMQNVRPDGTSDLTLRGYAFVQYKFRSPSASQRGAAPAGVELDCLVHVFVTGYAPRQVQPRSDLRCDEKIIGPPRCTARDVWKQAIASGIPENAVAQVQWMTDFNDKTQWLFMIMGGPSDSVRFFQDDCGAR